MSAPARVTYRHGTLWLLAGILAGLAIWVGVQSGLGQWVPGGPDQRQLLAFLESKAGGPHAAAPGAKSPAGQKESAGPTHSFIQALLQALEAFHGEGAEAKDVLRSRLQQADQQLQAILAGRKQKILQANQKPPLLLIEEPSRPPKPKEKSPPSSAGRPSAEIKTRALPSGASRAPASSAPAASSGQLPTQPGKSFLPGAGLPEQAKPANPPSAKPEVHTAIVRALLEVLDNLKDVSEQQRQSVRQLLLEADKDLQKVLESRSANLPVRAPREVPPPANP